MAVWQFKFNIVPAAGIIACHGKLVDYLPEYQTRHPEAELKDEDDFFDYWGEINATAQTFLPLTVLLPEIVSWNSEARMFGSKGGNQIEIWNDGIYCSLDASHLDFALLEKILCFASENNCMIVTSDDGRVITSTLEQVVSALNRSRAAKFLAKPVDYLQNRPL